MNTLLSNYGTVIAIIIRILSSIISLFFCIPLQIKEAKVNNGLKKLRYQLLLFGVLLLIMNTITSLVLTDNFFSNIIQKPFNAFLQIVNSFIFLALALNGLVMYKQQYSEENKEFHRKVEELQKN